MAISVGDAVLHISGDTSKLEKSLQGVNKKMGGWQSGLKKVGIGAAIGFGAIIAGGTAAIKMAADFESGMAEVNTMMNLSETEFKAFSDEVLGLAKDMGVDAVESANALYQAISAGVPKENAIEFLTIATKAAIGGVTDTETAVDGLTTVINAFKLPMADAEKVADLMFTTVKGGKTTFEELSASLFNVAPIAAASGVAFEEVSAALATMTKQGIPTTQATTQLRQAMVALQKPTADMNNIISDLGYESGQAMLADLGLAETLNTLRDATDDNNEMLMKMFGSVEAGQAVLALTGENADMFTKDLGAMKDAAGASQKAFEVMENSTSRKFEKLQEKLQGVAVTIGNALMPLLEPLIVAFEELIEALPIKEIAKMIGDLLPPLVKLFLNLMKAIPLDILIKFVNAALNPMLGILVAILPILEPILFIFGKLLGLLTPVLDILGRVLGFVAKILGSGITSLLSGVTSLFGGTSKGFKMPSFQGFEGVIPGIPGTPMLATVHAGEYIGQGGGNTVNIYNPVVRNDRDIQEMTRQISREQYRMQQLRMR